MAQDKKKPLEEYVKDYVLNGVNSEKAEIVKFKGSWEELTEPMIVYRGQAREATSPDTQPYFFSTTTDRNAVQNFYIREGTDKQGNPRGCFWTILLKPGIRIMNVAKVLGNRVYSETNKQWESEIFVESGGEMFVKESTMRTPCSYNVEYGPMEPIPVFNTSGLPKGLRYLKLHEVTGGKRRKTRRKFKMPRKMTRKYCKKTPCRKMGFTQKASCRPYKNCYRKKK